MTSPQLWVFGLTDPIMVRSTSSTVILQRVMIAGNVGQFLIALMTNIFDDFDGQYKINVTKEIKKYLCSCLNDGEAGHWVCMTRLEASRAVIMCARRVVRT
jgi:hypothetical protein